MKVLKEIEKTDFTLRKQVFELLGQLSSGEYRVFYYLNNKETILVFHFFKKKSKKTLNREIKTAQIRLEELL